jgi:hypothetical protein
VTISVRVKNGTNAGWKRPKEQNRADWRCDNCGARNRYYWTRCPICQNPRP